MEKKLVGLVFSLLLVFFMGCTSNAHVGGAMQASGDTAGPSGPAPIEEDDDPVISKGSYGDDKNGNITFENIGRKHYMVYLDGQYVKSIRASQTRVSVDSSKLQGISSSGKRILFAYYYYDKARAAGFTDYKNPPEEALCRETNIVLASASEKRSIMLSDLREEEIKGQEGLRRNNVMVKFRYPMEDPRLQTTVVVYTGNAASPNILCSLEPNNQVMEAILSTGLNNIRYNYSVGSQGSKRDKYFIFPEGIEKDQMMASQYNIIVNERQEGTEFIVPQFAECGKVSWIYDNETLGMITVRNKSRLPQRISNYRRAVGTNSGSQIPWNTIDRNGINVLSGDEWIGSGEEKSYSLDSGVWEFRSTIAGRTGQFAHLEPVSIEKGMHYFWYLEEDENTFVAVEPNPPTARYIESLLQQWTLNSKDIKRDANGKVLSGAALPEVAFKVNITAHNNQALNTELELGTSDGKGQLKTQQRITNLLRGITAKNSRDYTVTITASKDGYGPASQAINAFTLISFGKSFAPEDFNLSKASPVGFEVEGPYLVEMAQSIGN